MQSQKGKIAIIGMSGIFPKAENLEQYWNNILQAVDCITDIPPTHWSVEDYFDPDPKAEDKTYCKRGGFIPAVNFDPLEFGLPPNILENIDVAQLLALVVAKRTLQDASYGEFNPYASTTGVTLGVSSLSSTTALTSRLQYPIWEKVLKSVDIALPKRQEIIDKIKLAYVPWHEDSFPGYLSNVVAGRIANRLNLGGINCSVDAACASSMAALQIAMDELLSHRSDMMITGGVDLNNGISAFVSFSKTPAFTQHHNMRPFDDESDGMLIGEGVGMLALRRLEDAKKDGNKIYAVISGIGASSDGKHKSIYAPSRKGQELALRRAYSNAGICPSTIGLVEAHGTGTATGDPEEFSALRAVFGEKEFSTASIALGSVKSQIGHTKVAAGVAGIIKTALALYHKVLPPTINIVKPNTKFSIDNSPFYLNTKVRPWFSSTQRRAGVSAFGFGGTNFHIVMEELDEQIGNQPVKDNPLYQIIFESDSSNELLQLCLAKHTELTNNSNEQIFAQLIEHSVDPKLTKAARIGFLTRDESHFIEQLEIAINRLSKEPGLKQFSIPGSTYYREIRLDKTHKTVALFSGQGSQYLEMGRTLCSNYTTVKQLFFEMDSILAKNNKTPITDIIFPKPSFDEQEKKRQSELLQLTQNTQPAIGTLNIALFKLLKEVGFMPDFVAGHSLGELSALCAAQAISEKDYLQLLYERGQAMAKAPSVQDELGAMLAVNGDSEIIESIVKSHHGVYIANRNSCSQLVLAGASDNIEKIYKFLLDRNINAVMLPVSGAFHTKFMQYAQKTFAKTLEKVTFHPPKIPVYSNNTAKPYPPDPIAIQNMLGQHITNSVNFKQEIEQLYAEGVRTFIEFGPGNILTRLVNNILEGQEHITIALNANKHQDSDLLLQEAILQMRVAGIQLKIEQELKKSSLSAKKTTIQTSLCGAAYISDKTKQAFEQALVNKNTTSNEGQSSDVSTDSFDAEQQNFESIEEEEMNQIIQSSTLDKNSFTQQNGDVQSSHQQYLKNAADYSLQFFQLIQQQYVLLNSPNCSAASLQSFEKSIALFNEQHLMMHRAHEEYLSRYRSYNQHTTVNTNQNVQTLDIQSSDLKLPKQSDGHEKIRGETTREDASTESLRSIEAMLNLQPQNTVISVATTKSEVPDLNKPPAVFNISDSTTDDTAQILLTVISEKTGYPQDMLDLSMELDADLGIDSIKRVEILAGLEGRISGDFTGLNFEKFAELRTLGQIAEYLGGAKKKTLE